MIAIRNIYYMLSYAFRVLQGQGYKKIETEDFENAADLCATILVLGVTSQVKRGLGQSYIENTDTQSSIRGKIEVSASVKEQAILKKQAVCTFDEYSANTYMNQIIKSTMIHLLRADIPKSRKKEIKRLLLYFGDVDEINLNAVNWHLNYNRNNQTYQMLIAICNLIVKGLLQSNADGSTKMMEYLDEQRMCRLYEKFILEYYRKEFKGIITANASQIAWCVDDGFTELLPEMQTDIMLSYQDKILIIDAKYYAHTTQVQFGKQSLHSGNLYQIFTYVKNKEAELADTQHEVSGMLLYAKTEEEEPLDREYRMSGNKISVKTLDLNADFKEIRGQLDEIVWEWFGVKR